MRWPPARWSTLPSDDVETSQGTLHVHGGQHGVHHGAQCSGSEACVTAAAVLEYPPGTRYTVLVLYPRPCVGFADSDVDCSCTTATTAAGTSAITGSARGASTGSECRQSSLWRRTKHDKGVHVHIPGPPSHAQGQLTPTWPCRALEEES